MSSFSSDKEQQPLQVYRLATGPSSPLPESFTREEFDRERNKYLGTIARLKRSLELAYCRESKNVHAINRIDRLSQKLLGAANNDPYLIWAKLDHHAERAFLMDVVKQPKAGYGIDYSEIHSLIKVKAVFEAEYAEYRRTCEEDKQSFCQKIEEKFITLQKELQIKEKLLRELECLNFNDYKRQKNEIIEEIDKRYKEKEKKALSERDTTIALLTEQNNQLAVKVAFNRMLMIARASKTAPADEFLKNFISKIPNGLLRESEEKDKALELLNKEKERLGLENYRLLRQADDLKREQSHLRSKADAMNKEFIGLNSQIKHLSEVNEELREDRDRLELRLKQFQSWTDEGGAADKVKLVIEAIVLERSSVAIWQSFIKKFTAISEAGLDSKHEETESGKKTHFLRSSRRNLSATPSLENIPRTNQSNISHFVTPSAKGNNFSPAKERIARPRSSSISSHDANDSEEETKRARAQAKTLASEVGTEQGKHKRGSLSVGNRNEEVLRNLKAGTRKAMEKQATQEERNRSAIPALGKENATGRSLRSGLSNDVFVRLWKETKKKQAPDVKVSMSNSSKRKEEESGKRPTQLSFKKQIVESEFINIQSFLTKVNLGKKESANTGTKNPSGETGLANQTNFKAQLNPSITDEVCLKILSKLDNHKKARSYKKNAEAWAEYKLLKKIGEGTFSEVFMGSSLKNGLNVAIKIMKNEFESLEKVNHLREIQALKKLSPHENIIKLIEVLYDETSKRLALVFELMEMNLYDNIKDKKNYLNPQRVKTIMYQLLKSIEHMHRNGIFHRDIKPENILLQGEHLRLADFGSCKGMFSEHPFTEYISTRWYRAPECLLTDGYYDYKMDVWGAGCVFFEIISLYPLFPGNNELDQIHKIHNVLGTPTQRIFDRFKKHATHMEFNFVPRVGSGIEKLIPHASPESIDLVRLLLTYDPEERITATQALRHEYFRELWEMDQQKDFQSSLNFVRIGQSTRKVNDSLHQSSKNDSYMDSSQQEDNPKKDKSLLSKKGQQNGRKSVLSSLHLTLKIEGINKSGASHMESSADMEMDKSQKGQIVLPPIKGHHHQQHQAIPGYPGVSNEGRHKQVQRKKDPQQEMMLKKVYENTLLKPNLSNQYLIKKAKKTTQMYQPPLDYFVLGKKTLMANPLSVVGALEGMLK